MTNQSGDNNDQQLFHLFGTPPDYWTSIPKQCTSWLHQLFWIYWKGIVIISLYNTQFRGYRINFTWKYLYTCINVLIAFLCTNLNLGIFFHSLPSPLVSWLSESWGPPTSWGPLVARALKLSAPQTAPGSWTHPPVP